MKIEIPESIAAEHPKDIAVITDYLVMTMGDDNAVINAWLNTAKAKLNGQSPIQELHTQDGRTKVIALLRTILEQDSRIG